jgi:phosphatidylglycerol:prolipoprotein diacylglycerol transferase
VIQIPFDPEIHFGPFGLAWHGVFTAVGIFFGVWLPIRLLRGRVSEEAAWSVATWGVVGGIVGARLLHVADRWDFYSEHLDQILYIWTGGIAVWGAAIGGVLGGLIAAIRRSDVPIGATADAAASGLSLGFAVGRIGDIINGEHHAVACGDAPGICVAFTNPNTLGQGPLFAPGDPLGRFAEGPVHLVVAYDMFWDLLGVALVLFLLRTQLARPPQGRIFWVWVLWYAIGRFALGFLRIGDPTPIAGLRQDQLVSVVAALVAIPAFALIHGGILPRALRLLPRVT